MTMYDRRSPSRRINYTLRTITEVVVLLTFTAIDWSHPTTPLGRLHRSHASQFTNFHENNHDLSTLLSIRGIASDELELQVASYATHWNQLCFNKKRLSRRRETAQNIQKWFFKKPPKFSILSCFQTQSVLHSVLFRNCDLFICTQMFELPRWRRPQQNFSTRLRKLELQFDNETISAVAKQLRDAAYNLEIVLCIKSHKKLPNCHFSNLDIVFIYFLSNFLLIWYHDPE